MAWTRNKTMQILTIMLALTAIFAIAGILLLLVNLMNGKKKKQYATSFIYLLGSTFITGIGCIWFRINQSKMTCTHGVIHTIALILMVVGHREIITLMTGNKAGKGLNKYPISILAIAVYIVQYILSYHFVVFRYGRTPAQKAFRSGLHAFVGALTFFICVVDGIIAALKMARDEGFDQSATFHVSCICIQLYGVCTWYLFLNPYFDWRRLNSLNKSRAKASPRKSGSSRSTPPRSTQSRPSSRPSGRPSSRSR